MEHLEEKLYLTLLLLIFESVSFFLYRTFRILFIIHYIQFIFFIFLITVELLELIFF